MNTEPLKLQTVASDAEIVQAIKGGDTGRYGELVERYRRMIYGIAWSRVGNADLCEDVVQDAFLQAYRFLPLLRSPNKFPAWIGRIARNLSVQVLRKASRERIHLHQWALEQQTVTYPACPGDSSSEAELHTAMASLSDNLREALVLYYVQGQSVREAALSLGLSESAYKTRLHRARQALRAVLEQRLEEALQNMQPRPDTRARVMAGVAATPAIQGFSLSGMAGTLLFVLPHLFNFLFVWGWIGWTFKHVGRNYRSGAEIRRRVMWYNFAIAAVTVTCAVTATLFFAYRFGFIAFYWWLAGYMGAASIVSLWQVRVTPHPMMQANATAYPVIAVVFAAIALGLLPAHFFILGFLLLTF